MIILQAGIIVLLGIYGCVDGRSFRHHNAEKEHESELKTLTSSNFIGVATNELATAMLQQSLEEDGNYVFSPVGYSTILAILAEGARGETRDQLATSLHLPEDLAAVRQAYKSLLHRMKDRTEDKPEFKNWFYAYRNYSIQSQYRDILLENYLTEVKAVEFDYTDNSADDDLLPIDKKKVVLKEIIKENEDKKNTQNDQNKNDRTDINDNVVKDKVEDENKNKENEVVNEKEQNQVVESKPTVEHVEVPKSDETDKVVPQPEKNKVNVDTEKISQQPMQEKVEQSCSKETSTTEVTQPAKIQQEASDKEQVSDKENDVVVNEGKVLTRKVKERRYFLNKDTVTALTANRLSSSKKSDEDGVNSNKRIIIFNGFYYKGNWTVKFEAKKDEGPEGKTFFYTSESEKKPAKMMTTVGDFEIGQVPELESTALEVPYVGNKYSLLILLPNERNGLKKLASDLVNFPLPNIDKYLTKKQVQICLPRVNFYTISKPKPSLLKGGVKNLFDSSADLTGINAEGGLYLDELVQLVTMNFEESSTETNFLTSSLAVERSNAGPEHFNANHPFFFFLRERQDGVILAAGKLQDPTKTQHQQ